MEKYICIVCGFDELIEPPFRNGIPSYEICPCCGFEFGFDDKSQGQSVAQYRKEWLKKGTPWFQERRKPPYWNLKRQLENLPIEKKTDNQILD